MDHPALNLKLSEEEHRESGNLKSFNIRSLKPIAWKRIDFFLPVGILVFFEFSQK